MKTDNQIEPVKTKTCVIESIQVSTYQLDSHALDRKRDLNLSVGLIHVCVHESITAYFLLLAICYAVLHSGCVVGFMF